MVAENPNFVLKNVKVIMRLINGGSVQKYGPSIISAENAPIAGMTSVCGLFNSIIGTEKQRNLVLQNVGGAAVRGR